MVRNSRFLRDWKKSHSQSVLKKWMFARLIHFFAFHFCWWIRRVSYWRESVYLLRRICVKRERVFEDDVFKENTCLGIGSKKRKTKFTRGRSFKSVTWFSWPMVSRDWMCAFAIFVVGTNGIPPKLNNRSVKSYKVLVTVLHWFWLYSISFESINNKPLKDYSSLHWMLKKYFVG